VPDYRELYYAWEHQQWEAGAISFEKDRRQWSEQLSPELKRSILWVLSPYYVSDERGTNTLVPFVDAAPTEEQQVFLTTQLADAARHAVFFDRLDSDVLDNHGSNHLNDSVRTLLLEMLPVAVERVRAEPQNLDRLVEGVVLYHLVIEGTLALTGRHFLLGFARALDILPGFRQGFTAIARDGARHVTFGVRFLEDMVKTSERYAGVIRRTLAEVIPASLTALEPPGGDMTYLEPLPYGLGELTTFARDSLTENLNVIGVELPV
jgi:ribonucleoside-diphosphate reductase beta chain